MASNLETPRTERPEISTYSSWQTAREDADAPTPRRLDSGTIASIVERLDESKTETNTSGTEHLTAAPKDEAQRFSSAPTVRDSHIPTTSNTDSSSDNKASESETEKSRPLQESGEEHENGKEVDLEAGKSQSPSGPDDEPTKDPNLIDWDGPDDKENPMNWPFAKKAGATMSLAAATFCITFASSIFSTATGPTSMEFGVSEEVMILGTSLFVLGFAVGPMIWGPMSELYGRKIPLMGGFFVFAIFQIPVAVAVNLETIMLCRYVGGLFGSSALAVIGGALADFWNPVDRGVAICFFAGATFLGPVFGPIIGSFLTQSYLGWRWTAWITLIMAAFLGTVALFAYPETYAPRLLQQRAKRIRFETKNWAIHAKADEQSLTVKDIVERYLARPFVMIAKEPILVLVTSKQPHPLSFEMTD